MTNGFEQFWQAYPRKVGKLAAEREWQRRKLTPEQQQWILRALDWQRCLWAKDASRFIPHPRTYLSQGRWMDEPPPSTSPLQGLAAWVKAGG